MITTVRDLIGALQRNGNNQLVKVNNRPISNVIAPSNTGTVQIYTVNEPNPSSVSVAANNPSGPIRLEEC